jgi:predicted ATPase
MSLRGSRRQPLIIAVEDLHWIDQTSEDFLTLLVDSLAGAPILLLLTYRPGYRPPWIGKSYRCQLTLQPLTPQDSRSIVQSVLRTAQPSERLMQTILDKAAGNPFSLEELAWTTRQHDDHHSDVTVPDTIQGVLMARIDRLSTLPRQLLQTAAVPGQRGPAAALRGDLGRNR